jgi:hypothetical protein
MRGSHNITFEIVRGMKKTTAVSARYREKITRVADLSGSIEIADPRHESDVETYSSVK